MKGQFRQFRFNLLIHHNNLITYQGVTTGGYYRYGKELYLLYITLSGHVYL